ncbi:hypothetical protein BBC0178_012270 [Bartonella apihabitans]|uniref:Phosphoribosyl-AMP cyclohydrolase n=1 Tax=Bartonella apihabitans TaxID=2750929 RepID=A0A1U9MB13_9HYPH|nr:hypothetical protein BBC0178_012270 [Bartonella apihabitans]
MSEAKNNLEEGTEFLPKFDSKGLVTAVVTDAESDGLLMVAFMNQEALKLTLKQESRIIGHGPVKKYGKKARARETYRKSKRFVSTVIRMHCG